MSVLTLPLFSSHLLRCVTSTQGLMTEREYHRCPPEDQPEQQQRYLVQCLDNKSHEDLVRSVHESWQLLRRESALLRLCLALQRHNCAIEFKALMRLGAPEQTASTVATAPEAKPQDANRACQRLFVDAKEKEQLRGMLERMKVERETAGCTFQPSLCARHSVPSSQISTPSEPRDTHSTPVSAYKRLYQDSQRKLSTQRLRETERLESETRECTFKPQVKRSQTPQPAGDRCAQLHQKHAQNLHRRRREELSRSSMEIQGLTFTPTLTPYQAPVRASQDPPVRLKPRAQAVRLT